MTTNEYFQRKEKALEMYEQGHPIEEISLTVGLTVLALESLFKNHEKDKADENEYMERAKKAIEMHERGYSITEISKALEFHPSFLIRLFEGYEEGRAVGRMIAVRDTIINMLRYERPIKEIMKFTKASVELIEEIKKGEGITEDEYAERAEKAIEMYKRENPIEEISLIVGLTTLEMEVLFGGYEDGKREEKSKIKLYAAFRQGQPLDTVADEFGMELSQVQEMYERFLVEMSKEGEL